MERKEEGRKFKVCFDIKVMNNNEEVYFNYDIENVYVKEIEVMLDALFMMLSIEEKGLEVVRLFAYDIDEPWNVVFDVDVCSTLYRCL